jgi:hypothetical protein
VTEVGLTSELPGNSGLKVYISAMMAPIAKRSMGALYTCDRSSTSGARYLQGSCWLVLVDTCHGSLQLHHE